MASRVFTLEELDDFGANTWDSVWTGESWDSRWYKYTDIVFEADGRFYQTVFCQGLTEYQYVNDWERYPEAVYSRGAADEWTLTCNEVESYEEQITIKKWRDVV